MLLRDHPLLTYQNSRSWPPAWLWCGGFNNTYPRGEVGILKNVFVSPVKPSTRCFLIMEHAGAEYIGDLSISDAALCLEMYAVLRRHCGKTLQEIGDVDLSGPKAEHNTRRSTPMLLRDHPLMSHCGVPNWPPVWTWTGGLENTHAKGEVGILKAATLSNIGSSYRCYLHIYYEGSVYIGCLLFDDHAFCGQLAKLLEGYCNRHIAEIGCIDLSHTL